MKLRCRGMRQMTSHGMMSAANTRMPEAADATLAITALHALRRFRPPPPPPIITLLFLADFSQPHFSISLHITRKKLADTRPTLEFTDIPLYSLYGRRLFPQLHIAAAHEIDMAPSLTCRRPSFAMGRLYP